MKMNIRKLLVTTGLSAAAALAGCGGGGPDAGDETAVPDAAVSSPEAYTRWVRGREASETRDPLAMNSTMPPTSETAEPVDID